MADDWITWFALKGINDKTIDTWGIYKDIDTGEIVFPYPHGVLKRRGGWHDRNAKRTFRQDGNIGVYYIDDPSQYKKAIICEGETDCLRLWQEYDSYFVCSVPGQSSWAPSFASIFNDMDEVLVVFDNDPDAYVQDKTDATIRNIKRDIGIGKVRRLTLPVDVKDVCEFFKKHSVAEFDSIIEAASTGNYHWKPLDLTIDPGPTDWLIEPVIAKGDVVMLLGEPNSGKSMVGMSMAAAIARQDEVLWQTYNIHPNTGRVLIVDEENPVDVVFRRLRDFGISGHEDNIRYLFHQGVRLDRNADSLFEEAAAFKPDLIVLDSLVRLHSKDENSSSDMAILYNDSIKPLARELNCAVLLLHHAGKTDASSSYKRGRGSGELTASPDVGLDIRPLGDGRFNLVTYKTRRAAKADGTVFAIIEDEHGLRIGPDTYNPGF